MTGTRLLAFGFALAAFGCSAEKPPGVPETDCSVADAYEFRNIEMFSGTSTGWFQYADTTPGGVPNVAPPAEGGEGSNVPRTQVPDPGRCGDTFMMRLRASGHNFYGVGYGDYQHNLVGARADGTGYDGISFWARSEVRADKTFLFNVEDGRTIKLPLTPGADGLVVATDADEDLNEDGYVGPGDIARGTRCRLPPPQEIGRAACYEGGEAPPSTPTRIPEPDECGNQFHTYITLTTEWQLIRLPWEELNQWPCPNRLEGGIDASDIAGFEIKLKQGTTYDFWLDNIAFYRLRSDDGG